MTRLKIIAGCVLIGMLWGGVMLSGSIQKLDVLRHDAIIRQQQNAAQKKIIQSKLTHLTKGKSELLDALLNEAEARGLLVTSVAVAKNRENSMQIKLDLQGNFLQFLIFIESLSAKKMCLQIDTMEVATVQSVETIRLTMTILSIQLDHAMPQDSHIISDPFAANHFTNLLFDLVRDKKEVSIDEMNYVGYLQVGQQQMAVLQLPNGAALDVGLNERVGREHALVTRINETSVTFQINGKEKIKENTYLTLRKDVVE